jgi:hypothetical protein
MGYKELARAQVPIIIGSCFSWLYSPKAHPTPLRESVVSLVHEGS